MKKENNYFSYLKGNSRVCISFLPMWGIPFSFYMFYLGDYLNQFGSSKTQLGQIMMLGYAASLLFSMLSAPLVDRLGRKKSTFIFDMISSVIPPLIYFISGAFIPAMVATVLYNTNKIMSVGYYLLMIEDADDRERIIAMNLFNLIIVVAGILIPAAGVFVAKYGLVGTQRVILMFSFISMLIMVMVRNQFLKETSVGEKLMKNKGGFTPGMFISPYQDSIRFLRANPTGLCLAAASVLISTFMGIATTNSLYFITYFSDKMGMSSMQSSLLGTSYFMGLLLAMIFINPQIRSQRMFTGLAMGGGICLAGCFGMIVSPAGNIITGVLAVFILAVGYGILRSGLDGALAIYSQGQAQSGIYSLVNFISSAMGIIASGIAAVLYPKTATSIYLIGAVMIMAILLSINTARKAAVKN